MDGNFTGYGFSLSSTPLSSAVLSGSSHCTTSVWPAGHGLAVSSLYRSVIGRVVSTAKDCSVSKLGKVTPDILRRFEVPLGHEAADTLGIRFQPVDLWEWNVGSQDGMVKTAKSASAVALEDRASLHVCRCDENIYRRLTKCLCAPGGEALGAHWNNNLFVLSQWHGYKHLALLFWHHFYTPLYSHFLTAVYPEPANVLRNANFAHVMMWNNSLASMILRPSNKAALEECFGKHPGNKKVAYVYEFFNQALPQVLYYLALFCSTWTFTLRSAHERALSSRCGFAFHQMQTISLYSFVACFFGNLCNLSDLTTSCWFPQLLSGRAVPSYIRGACKLCLALKGILRDCRLILPVVGSWEGPCLSTLLGNSFATSCRAPAPLCLSDTCPPLPG